MDDGTSGLKNENAINFPKRRSVRALPYYIVRNDRVLHRKYISGLDQVSTPQLFYTYFCNHAHRLRLEKLL